MLPSREPPETRRPIVRCPRILRRAFPYAQLLPIDLDVEKGLVAPAEVARIVDIEQWDPLLRFLSCTIPVLNVSHMGMPVENRQNVVLLNCLVISLHVAWVPL